MTEHIRINDVAPRIHYDADGIQSAFTYPFAIFKVSDLEVWQGDMRQTSNFTVSGVGISTGGTVLFALPPPAGTRVTLHRRLILERVSDYQADGIIRAKTLNDELDYQVAALQQVAEDVGRALKLAPTSSSPVDLTLPEPAAGRGLKWNPSGSALVNSDHDPDMPGNAAQAAADAQAAAVVAGAARDQAVAAAGGVKVSANDATLAQLATKLVAGPGITVTELGDGGDERLSIASTIVVPQAITDRLSFLERNLAITVLRDQIDTGWSVLKMVDGIADEFEDQTGIDTTGSSGQAYDSTGDYYGNGGTVDANTKLLLCANGTNNSTTFTDDGALALTVTRTGSPVVSTAQSKFGGASAYFGTETDAWYLSVPTNTAHDLSGDFTIDCWAYITGTDTSFGIARKIGGAGTNSGWTFTYNGSLCFYLNGNTQPIGVTWTPIRNAWVHMAVVRSGNNWYLFINGTQIGSTAVSSATITASGGALEIGAGATYNSSWVGITDYPFPGYMDEFRISSVARWIANFTPPTQPYKTPVNMALKSNAYNADAQPVEGRLVLLHQPVAAITLNTDLIAEISRDGGTTWTAAPLTDEGAFDTTTRVLAATADVSAQPAGTAMCWRLRTLNTKEQRLHGVWLQWR